MTRFATQRLAAAVVIIAGLTLVMFVLQKNSAADPVRVLVGAGAPASVVEAERHRLGYDEPLSTQFIHYLVRLLHGNLGMSLHTRQPVTQDLSVFLPPTIELALCAMLAAMLLAIIIGFGTLVNWPGSGVIRWLCVGLASAPGFLLAIVAILIFSQQLGWLPATGQTSASSLPPGPTHLLLVDSALHGRFDIMLDAGRHLILPCLCLAVGPGVAVGRMLRSSLVVALASDHVRTARSKGLSNAQLLLSHCVRNAANAPLAMLGLQIGALFASQIVVESVFAWPGLGSYVNQSIPTGDFPAVAGVTLLLGVSYVAINAVVDLLQAAADPRIATP